MGLVLLTAYVALMVPINGFSVNVAVNGKDVGAAGVPLVLFASVDVGFITVDVVDDAAEVTEDDVTGGGVFTNLNPVDNPKLLSSRP